MSVVVVSGNPRPGSRTVKLATEVASALGAAFTTIDVGDLGPGLLTPGDLATAAAVERIRSATLLIVATPTYKGAYTGILKVLFDQLPANALAGITAVPVVTAGVAPQAAAAEAILRQLLTELGATVPEPGLRVTEPELADIPGVAAAYAPTVRR